MRYIIVIALFALSAEGFRSVYPRRPNLNTKADVGEPLILTPLINNGSIDEARRLALVPPLVPNVTSYAGFLTVDEKCGSNMFFWFFPADTDYVNSPLSVWLQGGPGASSLYGLFTENSPLALQPSGELERRIFSWTMASSYLYIDNPVGTGFSFTNDDPACYSHNESDVGRNLLAAVKQFLILFPELNKAPFFVTGESYAGKYVPALAYAIHNDNKESASPINLNGIAIGNGLVDPGNQFHYGDYLYQIGLVDSKQRDHFREQEELARSYVAAGSWRDAFGIFDDLLNGDLISYPTYFKNCTGFDFYFNYLYDEQPPEGDEAAFVNKPEVRVALHVGNATFHSGVEVETNLIEDVMKPVSSWLSVLLDNYRVLIYNGQLDIIVAYPLTLGYLQVLDWSGAAEYRSAYRQQWYVGDELAGYVKKAGKLTEVLVRNAGHMVPADQPLWALDLISRFIHDKKFPQFPFSAANNPAN